MQYTKIHGAYPTNRNTKIWCIVVNKSKEKKKTLIFVCLEQTISAFVQSLRKTENFTKQKTRKEFKQCQKQKKTQKIYNKSKDINLRDAFLILCMFVYHGVLHACDNVHLVVILTVLFSVFFYQN